MVSEMAIGEERDESVNLNFSDNRLHGIRDNPLSVCREALAFYRGDGWRGYKDYIGHRLFYEGHTDEMRSAVLDSELVREKISNLARAKVATEPWATAKAREEREAVLRVELAQVALSMVNKILATPESHSFIKLAGFFVGNMLASLYHQGMHVVPAEIEMLTDFAMRAQTAGQSLILLPPHRSHVDYVSMQLCFYRLGLSLPIVVAGDNLDIPLLGRFLRNSGAYYIRRQWGGDELYSTVVQAYVDALLGEGYNLECFIEGSRSRTGKLQQPKLGMLRLICSSVLRGCTSDCWIVPTSVQYDKVIETPSYVSELLGVPKPKESLFNLISSSGGLLQLKMGRIDVRFAQPWSLKEFLSRQMNRTELQYLRTLGYSVLLNINSVSVVMPTALVGTVILTLRGRGVGKAELIRRFQWLRQRILVKKGRVASFASMPVEEVVDRALMVLKDLIGEVKGLLEPTYFARDRFQLSFYRNACIHHFISEVVIAVAMYTKIKQGGGPANQRVSYTDLYRHCEFLSQLLKTEFIFQLTGSIKSNINEALMLLQSDDVIRMDAEGFIELSEQERRQGRENYDFFCFLIWPFIDTYWLAAASLFMLGPRRSTSEETKPGTSTKFWVGQKRFQDMAQLFGKTLYNQGDLSYFEAVSKQTLGNAFQRFLEEGIIITQKVDETVMVSLHDDWQPTTTNTGMLVNKGKLWDMTEKISVCRREGKNRRDNETVSARVLGLAAYCAERLRMPVESTHPMRRLDRALRASSAANKQPHAGQANVKPGSAPAETVTRVAVKSNL